MLSKSKTRRRKRRHGFLHRMRENVKVIARRRRKGRKKLSA